jgi:hypothetical protein
VDACAGASCKQAHNTAAESVLTLSTSAYGAGNEATGGGVGHDPFQGKANESNHRGLGKRGHRRVGQQRTHCCAPHIASDWEARRLKLCMLH